MAGQAEARAERVRHGLSGRQVTFKRHLSTLPNLEKSYEATNTPTIVIKIMRQCKVNNVRKEEVEGIDWIEQGTAHN
ncbi:hypothetical protein NPX13_g5153 [Xylaria arbuscula]|uniref:Uncharacterized protein n=1 Tax=Xylaria arbuscula TaxID=114810 RepID=A0A9W8NE63_9PEZI|nr:hypothetical protein NPX13_g5153 [Xylaria arbuscula]